ncbi:MAG: transposase [Alphaproteobacteria bacterium]
MTETNIGIDISKDHLDVHRLPGDERRRFDNSKAGHKALIHWIGETPARVVYEPTGRYHRTLERALAAAGMPIAKVNPRQARRFAEATGNLAKTDALDAAMLTRRWSKAVIKAL